MRRSVSIHRRLVPVALVAALAAGLAGAAPAAAASTLVVAADGQGTAADCDDATPATSSTIQGAVDTAAAGDTIVVCPGSYTELVTVGAGKDGLTIAAARPFAAKVRVPQHANADALLTVNGADGVTIRGLSLLGGKGASCGRVVTGILVEDATDAVIRGNRIAPTAPVTRGPCSIAWGISIGSMPPRPAADVVLPASAFVAWNAIRDPLLGGIHVGGPDTSAELRRNSVRYWHVAMGATRVGGRRSVGPAANPGPAGIRIVDGADAVVVGNAISSGPDADPLADGGVTPVGPIVSTPVLPNGILAAGAGSVRIEDNLILRVRIGVWLGDAAAARVTDNRIGTVRSGIVGADPGARYLRNRIEGAQFGIFTPTGGQTFRDNVLVGSSRADCLDETTGSGTLGTADTWSSNSGAVSYPVGICGSGTPTIHVTFVVRLPLSAGTTSSIPTSVAGTWTTVPFTPVPLTFDGTDGWRATVDLPLGGSYGYHYLNQFGVADNACNSSTNRPLSVVNQGSLTMLVEDVFDVDLGLGPAVC